MKANRFVPVLTWVLACLALVSCGGGSSGSSDPAPSEGPDEPCEQSFDGTFAAVQEIIFARRGCTQDVCHGSARSGGLDLRPGAAYDNLFNVPATEASLMRVFPGDRTRSYLWRKLAASTDPSVEISGAPMPSGLPPLTADELELVRLWIYAGAPREGTVAGTEKLADACLPPLEPLVIEPLPPPPPGEGVQLVMPEWELPAASEHEICFASYYDLSDQVPAEFRDPSGQYLRFSRHELRQDPQSHHLILYLGGIGPEQLSDPSFGQWLCRGGEHAGSPCEPTELGACGAGLCASDPKPTFACIGYGPPGSGGFLPHAIGGAQQAQARIELYPGVFDQIPMRGVLYWNSHAFNLTTKDAVMHGRLNYDFAVDRRFPAVSIFDASMIFSANAAPYTTQTICNEHQLPLGARLYELTSHTHRRGKHFTVELPDGSLVYENFVYNDPTYQRFDPPLAFDSTDPAQRRLRFCSLYNNGVKEDGSPDPDAVTRASRVPQSTTAAPIALGQCSPVACVSGKIGAACAGSDDGAACDSTQGAGDGSCDACAITGGESTENEMFILIGQYFIDETVGKRPDDDDPVDLIPFR